MGEYSFVYYKKDSKKLLEFAKNNHKNINKIIRSCFDIDYRDNCCWLLEDDLFCLMEDGKIIAIAQVGDKTVAKYDKEVEKYKLITSNQKNKIRVTLFPYIGSLCRKSNPRYKGVGKLLLSKIEDYYSKEGQNRIYIAPESNRYKIYGKNDCGVEIEKEKYLKSQKKLHKYYQNFGFKQLKHHFEIANCSDYELSSTGPFVFYPIFYKDI